MDQSIQLTPFPILGSTKAQKGVFAKLYYYQPSKEHLKRTRGDLFAILSLEGLEDENADYEKIANLSFQFLNECFYSSSVGNPLDALQEAVKKAHAKTLEVITLSASPSAKAWLVQLNLAAAVIWGKVLYSTRVGECNLALFRSGELIVFDQEKFVSEELKDRDFLLLAASNFFKRLGTQLISEILINEPEGSLITRFTQEITSKENPSQFACFLIKAGLIAVPGEEEIIEIVKPPTPPSLVTRLTGFIQKIPSFVPLVSGILRPTYYLRKPNLGETQSKKVLVSASLIILLTLSILATRFYRHRQQQAQEKQEVLSLIDQNLIKAKEASSSNPALSYQLLQEAENKLGEVKGVSIQPTEAQKYEEQIRATLENLYQTKTVQAVKRQELQLSSQHRFVALYPTSQNPANNFYIFDDEAGLLNQERQAVLPLDMQAWTKILAVATYYDSLYLLDSSGQQIHKYLKLNDDYSKAFPYFKGQIDLKGAVDLAIDGAVYLLFEDGHVRKFLGGEPEEFSLRGFYPRLDGQISIFTTPESKYLYLTSQNYLLIFDKEGNFQFRLQLEGLSSIDDLMINELTKEGWFLSQGALYQADLSQALPTPE